METRLKELCKRIEHMLEVKLVTSHAKVTTRSTPLNAGLQNLDGEFVSFLDYDDIFYPSMGTVLIGALEEDKELRIAYGNSMIVRQARVPLTYSDSEDTHSKKHTYLYNQFIFKGYGEEFNKLKFLFDNYIPFNTYVLRIDQNFDATFDERLDIAEDWDFLLNLIYDKKFPIKYVDFNVSEYRQRNDLTHSFSTYTKKRRRRSRKLIYKKIHDHEYLISGHDVNETRSHFMPEQDPEDQVPTPQTSYTIGFAIRIIKSYLIWKIKNAKRILTRKGPVYFMRIILYKVTKYISKINPFK